MFGKKITGSHKLNKEHRKIIGTYLKQHQEMFDFGDLQKRAIVEYLAHPVEISEELWLNSRRNYPQDNFNLISI